MKNHTVFVASTLDGAPELAAEIVEVGEHRGARVIYHRAATGADAAVREQAAREIAECDCFLVVLRREYGEFLPGDERSFAHLQVERAIECGIDCFWAYALDVRSSEGGDLASSKEYDAYLRLESMLGKKHFIERVATPNELTGKLRLGFDWLFRWQGGEGKVVLISSTYRDLAPERDTLRAAVGASGLGLPVVMFEDLPKGMDALDTSKRLAKKAGLYFGLLSELRGSIAPGTDMTYTEIEYKEAAAERCPIVLFENPDLWVGGRVQQSWDDRKKTVEFNQKLRGQHDVHRFRDRDELRNRALDVICELQDAGKLLTAEEALLEAPRPAPPTPYFVHDYNLAVETALIGRAGDVEVLDEWVTIPDCAHYGARLLCIEAWGGMGKSALAWNWVKGLKPQDFDGVVWYSFYAVESGTHEFAESVLPYLTRLSGVQDITDSGASPLEQVLKILERKNVLLVLDGLERRMKLYTEFQARSAEGAELNRIVEARVERHSLAYDQHPPEVARELARRECFSLGEEDAAFLRRLARCATSRTLVTSRFFPSDLLREDSSATRDGVKRYKLEPFDTRKAKQLAGSMKVQWGPEFEALIDTVGGYPLYLALAFEYVRGASEKNSAEDRRKKLASALARPTEAARLAVVSLGIDQLDERQRAILYEIEACPIGSTFAYLRRSLCGPGMTFERPSDLEVELRRMHVRKLVGWDPASGSCDMHPVVREAVRIRGTPELRERLLERHKNLKPEVSISGRVTALMSPFLRRSLTILHLLEQGDEVEEAASFYLSHIDDSLRYRSAEIDRRREYLERFLRMEDRLSNRTRCRLRLELADSALLLGEPGVTQREAQRALALAQRERDAEGLRLSYLMLAHAAGEEGRLVDADAFLRQSMANGALHESDCSSKWTMCSAVHFAVAVGRYEDAETLLAIVEDRFGDDADVGSARLAYAIDGGSRGVFGREHVEAAYQDQRRRCLASSLYYGSLSMANGAAELALQFGQNDAMLDQLKAVLDDQAAQRFIERRLDLKSTLARLRTRQGRAEQGLGLAETVRTEAERRGLRATESRACLAMAEAYASRMNAGAAPEAHDKAIYYATEALILASADGAPYSFQPLVREITAFVEANGWGERMPRLEPCPPERISGIPAMPPLPSRPRAALASALPSGITDTSTLSDVQVEELYVRVRASLDWDNTTGSAHKWWETFEAENKHRRALVLRLAEELALRKATITEFFLAYVYSNTDNIQANLHYLDYTRLKKEDERKKKAGTPEAGQPAPEAPSVYVPEMIGVTFTDTSGSTPEQVVQKLAEAKETVGWSSTTGSARKWWDAFEAENQHRLALILRLVEQLAARRATITEFFLAYVYSNTDNIRANLSYLEYTRLKKEFAAKETARRKDQARVLAASLLSNYADPVHAQPPELTKDQAIMLRDHLPDDLSSEHQALLRSWIARALPEPPEPPKTDPDK